MLVAMEALRVPAQHLYSDAYKYVIGIWQSTIDTLASHMPHENMQVKNQSLLKLILTNVLQCSRFKNESHSTPKNEISPPS